MLVCGKRSRFLYTCILLIEIVSTYIVAKVYNRLKKEEAIIETVCVVYNVRSLHAITYRRIVILSVRRLKARNWF